MAKYKEWITEDGLLRIEAWAREGLTDDQIADKIGISRSTFYAWIKQYSDMSDALKRGKAPADFAVEKALFRRATGYDYDEKRIDAKGEIVTSRKHLPPDTAAAIFWLKNRRPDRWRDKPEAPQGESNDILQSLFDLMNRRRDEQD